MTDMQSEPLSDREARLGREAATAERQAVDSDFLGPAVVAKSHRKDIALIALKLGWAFLGERHSRSFQCFVPVRSALAGEC